MATYNVTENNHTIEGIRQSIGQSNNSIHSLICPGSKIGLFVFGNEEFCTFAPGKYTATDYDLVQAFYFLLVDVHFIRCRKKFHYHQFPDIDAGRGINEAGQTFTGHDGLAMQLDTLTTSGSYDKTFFTGIGASGNFGALQQSFTVTNEPERFLSYQNINRIPARNQPGLTASHLAQIAEVNNSDEQYILDINNITSNTGTKYFFSVSSKPFATVAVTSGESESSASQATFNVAKFDPSSFCDGDCTEAGTTTSEHINVSTEGPDKLIINFYGQMSTTFGNRTFDALEDGEEAPEEAPTDLWVSAPNADLYEAHTFESKSELKTAINDWATDDESALQTWGNIKYWDITAVTDFSNLFTEALGNNVGTESSPLSFDLSNWNTTGVTNMSGMFKNCTYIDTLGDISNWNTGNVDNMSGMFSGVKFLNYVDIGKWNVSNVIDMSHMFNGGTTNANYISNYSAFTLENWNVSKVQNMSFMFANNAFIRPNVSNWNVGSVVSMESMFESFGGAVEQTIGGNVQTFNEPIELNLSKWNTSKVQTMDRMFTEIVRNLNLGDLSNWNLGSVEQMLYMWQHYPYVPDGIENWCMPKISTKPTGWSGSSNDWFDPDFSSDCEPIKVTNIISEVKAGTKLLEINQSEQSKFPINTDIIIDPNTNIEESNTVVGHGSLLLESELQYDHGKNALIIEDTGTLQQSTDDSSSQQLGDEAGILQFNFEHNYDSTFTLKNFKLDFTANNNPLLELESTYHGGDGQPEHFVDWVSFDIVLLKESMTDSYSEIMKNWVLTWDTVSNQFTSRGFVDVDVFALLRIYPGDWSLTDYVNYSFINLYLGPAGNTSEDPSSGDPNGNWLYRYLIEKEDQSQNQYLTDLLSGYEKVQHMPDYGENAEWVSSLNSWKTNKTISDYLNNEKLKVVYGINMEVWWQAREAVDGDSGYDSKFAYYDIGSQNDIPLNRNIST